MFMSSAEMLFFDKLVRTNAPSAVILIRLVVGGVFLSEGVQKFLFRDEVGAGASPGWGPQR